MKILVCLKQVPDTETKIKIAADNASIDVSAIKWVINPYDEYAIEEAVKFKEANAGAQVVALSVGPKKRVIESLRTALAVGVDEAVVVDAPENIDPVQAAKLLAAAIKAEGGADIIYAGKIAIDDGAAAVPQMLAELLGLPHSSVVSKITYQAGELIVERDSDGGTKEIAQLPKPCVVAANKGLNQPRYASLPGIMKAKKKTIKELDGAGLVAGLQASVKTISLSLPPDRPPAKLIAGEASAQAVELVKLLRDEAKVL